MICYSSFGLRSVVVVLDYLGDLLSELILLGGEVVGRALQNTFHELLPLQDFVAVVEQ